LEAVDWMEVEVPYPLANGLKSLVDAMLASRCGMARVMDWKNVIRLLVARSDDEARQLWRSQQPPPFQVAALLLYLVSPCPMRDGSGCRASKKNRIEACPEAIPR
jgi:hypothetical protein